MYLRDLWASCLRRWPLLLIGLLLTNAVVYYASTVVKPTYEAQASVVLMPPQNREEPNLNRYLGLGGLQQSADVLARSMMSEETVDLVEGAVPDAEYRVEPDWSTSAPILVLTAESETSDNAALMLETVLKQLPTNLQTLQDAVAIRPYNQITSILVSRDTAPEPVEKVRIRILGVLGLGMLLIVALVVAAVDGLLVRRAERRNREDQGWPTGGPGADDGSKLDSLEDLEKQLQSAGQAEGGKAIPTKLT